MKKVIASVLLGAVLLGGGSVAYAAEPVETITAKSVQVVDRAYIGKAVKVYAYKVSEYGTEFTWSIGSGFFLENGYVVTAQHCIMLHPDATAYFVQDGTVGGEMIKAEVVAQDQNLDLALLKTDRTDHPYFELADTVSVGDSMTIVGNSNMKAAVHTDFMESKGNLLNLGEMISVGHSEQEILSREYRMLSSTTSMPGDSGGPALNANKEVIGVVIASQYNTLNSIIVKLDHLRDFVSKNVKEEERGVIYGTASEDI